MRAFSKISQTIPRFARFALWVLPIGLCACSPDAPERENAETESTLELFSWWTQAGEKEALAELIEEYHSQLPQVEVINAASFDPETARERLKKRMESNEPPDSFQAISGVDLMTWVVQNKMTPLTELAVEQNWKEVFPSEVLETVSKEGVIYAVPLNIERDNNLYYNRKVLKENNVTAPSTLEEFFDACTRLKKSKITPLTQPAAGWIMALLTFENLLPAVLGGEYYTEFFSGTASLQEEELRSFFEEVKKVLQCSDVQESTASWGASADTLYRGDAAMYVMGDWAKGYLEGGEDVNLKPRKPWVPNVDFGVLPGLGSGDYFVFNSAVFGLPVGALHPKASRSFLRIAASRAGQEAFNPLKGSIPARTDVDLGLFDEMVRTAADDFTLAAEGEGKLLPGYATLTTFDYQKEVNPSLLVFAVGGARARQLDPANVSINELDVQALNVGYIVGKIMATYVLLSPAKE